MAKVELLQAFNHPFDDSVRAARSCYSSHGVCQLSDQFDHIGKDTFWSRHHTVFQHAHFEFGLEDISRHLVWSFFHNHPYYNSSQTSQRYVEVKPGNVYIPPSLSDYPLEKYTSMINQEMDMYFYLIDHLIPIVEKYYKQRFPKRKNIEKEVKKKALEVARYVLPIGTYTSMVHTIDAVTLFRYYFMSQCGECQTEKMDVVSQMVDSVIDYDPKYKEIFNSIIPYSESRDKIEDKRKAHIGVTKRQDQILAFYNPHQYINMEELWEDPLFNNVVTGVILDPIAQSLQFTRYMFKKSLSHTADSQNQRHRTSTFSDRMIIIGDKPDYVIPELIQEDPILLKEYKALINRIWESACDLLHGGEPEQNVKYMLPNAVRVHILEDTSLLHLMHKYSGRLCWNAQEEIYKQTLWEIEQIRNVDAESAKVFLPPCGIRKIGQIYPICPEGKRFCGVRVWEGNHERKGI